MIRARLRARLAMGFMALSIAAWSAAGGAQTPSAGDEDPSSAHAASALFVLGDSLSDVGNAAGGADYALRIVGRAARVGLCNASEVLVLGRPCDDLFHERSRVGDGPLAVEYLAAHLGVSPLEPSLHVLPSRSRTATNYAVASAKARGTNVEDLASQVDWLLLDHAPLPPDAVIVLMIGGNDAIDALQADLSGATGISRPSDAILSAAVSAIGAAVERLLAFGARRLVVANVPDLSMLPAVRALARRSPDEDGTLAAARAISSLFDERLKAELTRVETAAGRFAWMAPAIQRFDLGAAIGSAALTIASLGGNAADACFDSDAYRRSTAGERLYHPDCAPPAPGTSPRFARFAFWDGIHPTSTAHALVGAALVEQSQRLLPSTTSVRSGRISMLP